MHYSEWLLDATGSMLVGMKPVSQAEQEALNRFGEAVRRAREGQGVSQEELAHRCGVSQAYVSGLEGGKRNPSLVSVLRIASGLQVAPERLLSSDGELD